MGFSAGGRVTRKVSGAKASANKASRGKASSGNLVRKAGTRVLALRHARSLLPHLHRHSQGKPFRAQAFRSYLLRKLAGKHFQKPSIEDAERILRGLSRARRGCGKCPAGPLGAWRSQGVRYSDPEGANAAWNLQGFAQGPTRGGSTWVAWNEYGLVYRLRRASDGPADAYEVVCTRAFKRHTTTIAQKTLHAVTEEGKRVEFKRVVIFEPRRMNVGEVPADWSFIYLHSFSAKGSQYLDAPHYFGVSGASIRVVLPTAPCVEQTCFKDWKVWKGNRLGWRRIKFTSWFDYLTDRAGAGENDLDLYTLLDMRTRLHALIRREVQRVGDPKRVIIGGASQGCCVALDAAFTYPDELAGVVGIVGHVLGSTPLDPAKRRMPLHLFHEASDGEMKWKWVRGTVQRLVDAGMNVISRREPDPSGSGHWIQEIEGQWIRSALRRIVHAHHEP